MQDCHPNAFGIRQLNPFRGVLQVFRSDQARALSANGQLWEIQVLSDSPQGLWANTPFGNRQFYTFGRWSLETGLRQVPINPLFNIADMIESAERLIMGLRDALDELPFPLADHYEAWLLDETNTPLALLRSGLSEPDCQVSGGDKWVATEEDDDGFVSERLLAQGLPNSDGQQPRAHAALLESLINQRSGQPPRAAYYQRHSDGSASPCHEPDNRQVSNLFPELPIRQDWPDESADKLIAEYIRWKAPELLMLPSLSAATRDRLEREAVKQAEAVARLWRLYPQIHNQGLLKQARVEAKIRRANKH